MHCLRYSLHLTVALTILLGSAALAGAAPGPDAEKELRQEALKLNDVTGDDPIKGKIEALTKADNVAHTKKLLAVAVPMAKEKEQPFNYNACYILAVAAHDVKEYDAAQTFYRLAAQQALAIKSGRKISESYYGLVTLLNETKKFEEAEKLCREFIEMEGDDTLDRTKIVMIRRLVVSLAKQGKFDEANKLVDNLLKLQPDNWFTLDLKGGVQREAGKYDEAAKTYEDVLDLIKKDKSLDDKERGQLVDEVRYVLSGVYTDASKIDKASEQLQALIESDPKNPTFHNDLGYIWADHDMNLEKAEQEIRKALELDRDQRKENKVTPEQDHDSAAYLDSLAWVLFKKKQYKEALVPMLEAVKYKDGQNVEIYDHLGDIHMALGQKDEAVAAWKKGVEIAGESKRDQARKAEVEKKLKANQ
jgi:tetratricopeptide (TPR) repeat protein